LPYEEYYLDSCSTEKATPSKSCKYSTAIIPESEIAGMIE
jgi:hypothetical protein